MVHSRAIGLASLLLALVIGLPLTLGACGGDDENKAATEVTEKDFDVNNFGEDSATIDNKYTPLVPGIQYVYEGESNRGQGRRKHQVIFTATDLTKEINGVRALVMWDQDINAGELSRASSRPLPRTGTETSGTWASSWPSSRKASSMVPPTRGWRVSTGQEPSVFMRGNPKEGTPPYKHGVAPKIGFGDVAKVSKTGQKNCVPTGCYEDVLVTDETNPLEPQDGHQLKYYAPNVGNIRAAPGKGGKEREVLVLVKVKKLEPWPSLPGPPRGDQARQARLRGRETRMGRDPASPENPGRRPILIAPIRAIVGSSLRFRLLVLGIAAGIMIVGITQLRDAPVDVLPEFTPPYVEVQTEALGPLGRGGRGADHRSARGGPAERRPGRRHDPLGVRSGPVVDRDGLRAGHRHLPGAPARAGAAHAGARAAERLQAADDAAAAVLVEPRDDDRPLLGRAHADREVGDRALDDAPAPDGRPGRRERVDLGHARPAAPGPGRPEAPARQERHAQARSSRPPVTRRSSRR